MKTILVSERRQSFLEGVLYLMIGMVAVAAFMTRSVCLSVTGSGCLPVFDWWHCRKVGTIQFLV